MAKVKIKTSPKKGDQVAFGLVSNLVQPLGNNSGEKQVGNTMRAIPREEANVEVEGGETVVGDTNSDGLMELFTFQGKRHSEGGMPVNLPPGSFIYSDTKKLKIKDKDILSKVFGLSYKKGGYTPAEISKKYQINKYIETIKDKDADAISKRSASEMIKKNTEKLGILALVQESMKGFPDGIPAIAESVMAGLQGGGQEQQEMPQADFGGYMPLALKNGGYLPKAQEGLTVNDVKAITKKAYSSRDPEKIKQTIELIKNFRQKTPWYSLSIIPGSDENEIDYSIKVLENSLRVENDINARKKLEEKVNTLYNQYKPIYDKLKSGDYSAANSNQLAAIKNLMYAKTALDQDKSKTAASSDSEIQRQSFAPANYWNNLSNSIAVLEKPVATQKPKEQSQTSSMTGAQKPGATQTSSDVVFDQEMDMDVEDWANQKAYGGSLTKYQKAGETHNGRVIAKVIKFKNGIGVIYTDGTRGVYTSSGRSSSSAAPKKKVVVSQAPSTAKDISTYDQKRLDEWKAKGINVTLPSQIATTAKTDTVPGLQKTRPTGVYGTEDYGSDAYITDFKTRQAEFIKQNPNFDPTKKADVGKFQDWYNEDIRKQAKAAGYTDAEIDEIVKEFGFDATQGVPNARDEKYGRYTWSRPTIQIGPKPEKTPESDTYYYCGPDGILSFSSPKGETVQPPAGVTNYYADAVDAKVACTKAGDELEQELQKDDTWMAPDIVNFLGALSQKYAKTTPVQQKYVSQTPGYVLMDPTRQLAANQEQMARMQQQSENTLAGNLGFASMLGASGRGFANAADILGNVERQNVGIVNQAYGVNAQLKNQEMQLNEQARGQYNREIAQKEQADTLAENTKDALIRDAFNTGWSNYTRDQMMEKVLFPQVYTNNLTGEVSFSGKGRKWDEPDVYVNPITGRRGSSDPSSTLSSVNEMRKKMIQEGWTPEGAEKFLTNQYGTKEETKRYGGRSGLLPVQPINFNDYFGF